MLAAMRYRLGDLELDTERFELRADGAAVAVEPQVLAVLQLLVEQRDRLVTKDMLIERVWGGRIVSEAAIASRIKSARAALGDDGTAQRMIRTVHGRGFRYVGEVAGEMAPATAAPAPHAAPARPALAVLPFGWIGAAGPHGIAAEAIPHELIAELARLRWLHVIARGSSFRLGAGSADVREVGARLGVGYCVSGTLEVQGPRVSVAVELADTRDAGVVWAERYAVPAAELHHVRADIVAALVSALDLQIPANEARRAAAAGPERIDAWAAYHLGLARMYRFTAADISAARAQFARAAELEPGFARALAGLSFTHFEDAFMKFAEPGAAARAARTLAEAAVAADPLDPFACFVMGRSFWLDGGLDDGLAWLDRATGLSPNYAQGIYATAWTQTLLARFEEGEANASRALALSPIDPLGYAMHATRALALLGRGAHDEAAALADRAARMPGAHVFIAVIAAASASLAGDAAAARRWAATARSRAPGLSLGDFFASFPFRDTATRTALAGALAKAGL